MSVSFNETQGDTFDLARFSDEIAMQSDRLKGSASSIATGRSLRKFRGSHGFIGRIPSGYVSGRAEV